MPNCPHCNAEVDVGQKICAWCGESVSAAPKPKAPAAAPPKPPQPQPPPPVSQSSQPTPVAPRKGPSASDARSLAKRGDLEGALRLYREILSNSPNDPEALFGTGGIHFKEGEHKRAIEVWLKLKVLDPNYPNLDQWIANAKKNLSPSGLSAPQSTSPPRQKSPSSPERVPPSAPPPREPEEDWQKQSVRIDHIDEEVLKEPPPPPKPKKETRQPEPMVEEDENLDTAPPDWLAKAGWGLALLYIALIWGIYYL